MQAGRFTALVLIRNTVAVGCPFFTPLYITAISRLAVVLMKPHSA